MHTWSWSEGRTAWEGHDGERSIELEQSPPPAASPMHAWSLSEGRIAWEGHAGERRAETVGQRNNHLSNQLPARRRGRTGAGQRRQGRGWSVGARRCETGARGVWTRHVMCDPLAALFMRWIRTKSMTSVENVHSNCVGSYIVCDSSTQHTAVGSPAGHSIVLSGQITLPKAFGARPRRALGAQRKARYLNFSRRNGSGVGRATGGRLPPPTAPRLFCCF